MQRVLSFPQQSNRGFGDESEFVTRRMCFSFMFSIGFLAILAGFLLGRFVFDQELELSRTKLRKAHQHHQQVFGIYKNYSQFNTSSLVELVSPSEIQRHLLLLQNVSGPSRSLHEARLIRSLMLEANFDLISSLVQLQTNLSFPDPKRVNQVLILREDEVVLRCNDSRPEMSEWFEHFQEGSVTVTGNLLYVNFGRDEDYHHLDSLGLTVKDNIVIARVGLVPPMDMVANALEHEAKGVILYLDPQQSHIDDPFISPSDLARLNSLNGAQALPVVHINPGDAEAIFREMSTTELSSESWRGSLSSTYPIGPGFPTREKKAVIVANTLNVAKKYYDVVGAVRGSQEPDRFVMLTEERTPESAAIIMEVIRTLGVLKKSAGWKPHRSIVIASWGAQVRYRSKEWWSQLRMKTVAYLKVDSPLTGNNSVTCRGTTVLDKVVKEAAMTLRLENPRTNPMLQMTADIDLVENGIPFLKVMRLANRPDQSASFFCFLAWKLADSHGLPFALDSFAEFLDRSSRTVKERFKMTSHNLFLDSFFDAIRRLSIAISSFQSKWSHADLSKSIEMRIMNDQYLRFVRALSCRDESGFQRSFRHIIFSGSAGGQDSSAGFGPLQDLLRLTSSTEAPDDLQQQIITHLAGLVDCINSARYALTDGLDTFVLGRNETRFFD